MGQSPRYHPPEGEGCKILLEHGLPLWPEPVEGCCWRRLSLFPKCLGGSSRMVKNN